MNILHSSKLHESIPDWDIQLANLARVAWTGPDNKCHFPYKPLITPEFWKNVVAKQWSEGSHHSWILAENGQIVSHCALINKGGYWELGRLFSSGAPKNGTSLLCARRLEFAREHKIHAQMECTQAHTRAQELAARHGLRFAGIGFLNKIDGINWDIIYFDTLGIEPFTPSKGVLANPLGTELRCKEKDRKRLKEIHSILSTKRGGILPPTQFHVLPELLTAVQEIIRLNTSIPSIAAA